MMISLLLYQHVFVIMTIAVDLQWDEDLMLQLLNYATGIRHFGLENVSFFDILAKIKGI